MILRKKSQKLPLRNLDGLFTRAMNERIGGVPKEWQGRLADADVNVLGTAIATLQTLRNQELTQLFKGRDGLFRLLRVPRPLSFSGLLYAERVDKVGGSPRAIADTVDRHRTVTGMVALTSMMLDQAKGESAAFGAAGRFLPLGDLLGGAQATRDMNRVAAREVRQCGRYNTALTAPRLAALTIGLMQESRIQSRPMLAGVMLLHAQAYEATGRNSDFYEWSERTYQVRTDALVASLDELQPQKLHRWSEDELPRVHRIIASTAMRHLTIELSSIAGGRPS